MLGFKRNNMFAKMQLRYEPLPLPVRTNIGDQEMQQRGRHVAFTPGNSVQYRARLLITASTLQTSAALLCSPIIQVFASHGAVLRFVGVQC